jgi:hypothetical protein
VAIAALKEGISMHDSLALQRLMAAALAADPALQARGMSVFDSPPADARPPYLALGPDSATVWGWKGGGGHEHRLLVSAWLGRDGLAGAKAVLGDIERAVLAIPRSGEGIRIVTLRLLRAQVRRNPKSWTEGRAEFLARTVEED